MSNLSDAEFETIFGGTPSQVASGLADYSRAAAVLSSDNPRLINEHPHLWIGVVDHKALVSGSSAAEVINKLEANGSDPRSAIVRFIDTEERTLIL